MGVCGQVVAIDNKESTRVFFSMDPALSLHPYTLIPHKTDWGGKIFVIQKNTSRILLLFPSPPAFLFLLINMICGWCTLFRMNSKTSRVWLTTTLEAVEYGRCYDFTAKMMVVGRPSHVTVCPGGQRVPPLSFLQVRTAGMGSSSKRSSSSWHGYLFTTHSELTVVWRAPLYPRLLLLLLYFSRILWQLEQWSSHYTRQPSVL